MAKRGRPKKFGRQPTWMLERRVMVLHAFNEARKNGEKYEAAVAAAIEAVKARYPQMRIGPRRVKGILADWQGQKSSQVLTASKVSDADLQGPEMQDNLAFLYKLGFPEDKKVTAYTVAVGPRPEYPRINAKQRKVGPSGDEA